VHDRLATAGPFVPLAALRLGLAYLVLHLTPLRRVVLAIGTARSDVAEFGARVTSVAPRSVSRTEPTWSQHTWMAAGATIRAAHQDWVAAHGRSM
jgi:hypothetical protein